jgi:hypothetical protein
MYIDFWTLVFIAWIAYLVISSIFKKLDAISKKLKADEDDEEDEEAERKRELKYERDWKPHIYLLTEAEKKERHERAVRRAFPKTLGIPPSGLDPAEVEERIRFSAWAQEISYQNMSNPRRGDDGYMGFYVPEWDELTEEPIMAMTPGGSISNTFSWWNQFLNALPIEQFPILAAKYEARWGFKWGRFERYPEDESWKGDDFPSRPEFPEIGQPALGHHNPPEMPASVSWWKRWKYT